MRILVLTALLMVADIPALAAADRGEGIDTANSIEARFEQASIELEHSLDGYLRYAAFNSPALRSAFYNWKGRLEHVGTVGSLPQPQLTYGYFVESVETRVGPQNQKLSFKQGIPWFGTLGAKTDIANRDALAAYEKWQAEKLRLLYRVKSAYYRYFLTGRQVEITRDNLELLTFWEKVLRSRYEVSLGNHPDLIKAQVELGQLENRLASAEEKLATAQQDLKSLLGVADSITLPVPVAFDHDADLRLSADSLRMLALANNPDLASIQSIVEREQAAVRLAGKSSYPSFGLGVTYIETGEALNPSMAESGKDPWEISVSIDLPIWFGKNKAEKRKAEADRRKADYAYQDARNSLSAHVERVVYEYNDATRQKKLYRDGLLAKAQQALDVTYVAYQASEARFLDVIDAQRQLLAYQLEYETARTTQAIKKAEIEMLTGSEQL